MLNMDAKNGGNFKDIELDVPTGSGDGDWCKIESKLDRKVPKQQYQMIKECYFRYSRRRYCLMSSSCRPQHNSR